jgi:hypothetical protein
MVLFCSEDIFLLSSVIDLAPAMTAVRVRSQKSSGEALRNKEERRAALACVRDVENVYSLPQPIVQVLEHACGTRWARNLVGIRRVEIRSAKLDEISTLQKMGDAGGPCEAARSCREKRRRLCGASLAY